jgi:DNA helicase INO80
LTRETPEVHHGTTDEELRLASSDLEDCEEVWIGELSDYMLETQKRQNQVADWFEASIVVSRSWWLSIALLTMFSRNATP